MQRNPDLAVVERPAGGGVAVAPRREEVRQVIAAGILAPTAHNAQPWRFRVRRGSIECRRVQERCLPHLDFEDGGTHVGFGTALENMDLQARALGLRADVRLFPDRADDALVATVELVRDPAVRGEPDLLAQVPRRGTNRRVGPRQPIGADDVAALRQAVEAAGGHLSILTDEAEVKACAPLVGEGDRVMFTERGMHHDVFEGMRWTPEQVQRLRYGLDAATMELKKPELAFVKLLGRWGFVRTLRALGAGPMLAAPGRQAFATASAIALITHPGTGPDSYVRGGRALERLWLRATERGLSVHPNATLPFLFARLERGGGQGLSAGSVRRLRALRPRYRELLAPPDGHAEAMLLRITRLDPPASRSIRFDLDALVEGASLSG